MRDVGIKVVLFDFGGVLAEEGFRKGLQAIARQNHLDPEIFFKTATETIYQCGYVTGIGKESDYWQLLRKKTRIKGSDKSFRNEILSRFIIRPPMIELVKQLRDRKYRVAILSDQTDWLDRLERKYHFMNEFDAVFNSYYLGKSKQDPAIFIETAEALNVLPQKIFLVDDNPTNIARAAELEMQTHLFTTIEAFRQISAQLITLNRSLTK